MKNRFLLTIFAGSAFVAASAFATVVDLTTSDSGTINGAQFVFTTPQPTGTGVIDPFLREQVNGSGGIEQGYNTSGRPAPFDDKSDPFTHNITVGDLDRTIQRIDGVLYYTLLLDINEPAASSLLSLDRLTIYTSTSGSITSTNLNDLGTVRYDLDAGMDSFVLLDASRNHGSGSGDMLAYIPVTDFAGAQSTDYVYLYALFGQNHTEYGDTQAQGGFEEWSLVNNCVCPVPEMSALFPIVGLMAAAYATQHVRKRNARRLAAAKIFSVG